MKNLRREKNCYVRSVGLGIKWELSKIMLIPTVTCAWETSFFFYGDDVSTDFVRRDRDEGEEKIFQMNKWCEKKKKKT